MECGAVVWCGGGGIEVWVFLGREMGEWTGAWMSM